MKFQRIGIPVFIILLLIIPVSSLDLGNVKPGFNEVQLKHSITIKLWGYDDVSSDLSRELFDSLPISMITESNYPAENKIDQYFISANQAFFAINNLISYTIDSINIDNETDYITSRMTYFDSSDLKGGISQTYYDADVLKSQTGYVIDSNKFGEIFENFNNPTGYTLHLLNLTEIDDLPNNTHSKHWYREGQLQDYPEQSDIRNVGIVGSNGLFYDPSASAPAYDSNLLNSSDFNQVVTTLSSRITELVENVFIGTPNAFSYNNLKDKAHFDLIIIGSGSSESNYTEVLRQIDTDAQGNDKYLQNALSELLPYLEVETETITISRDGTSNIVISNLITNFELQSSNNTGDYIKVSSNVAEEFKRVIRNHHHGDWPTGFYYSLFVFVDSSNRQFIWDVNGREKEYSYGKVGFSVLNLADWSTTANKDLISLKQRVFQSFGNMIGIPSLNNNFANQVSSVMSSHGITDEWDKKYNQFEIDSMARRTGTVFYNSAIHALKSLRSELKEGAFRWLDRSSLDDIELLMRQGQLEYERGNFTGSTKLYMNGYYDWLDAKEDLIQKQNAFYNGIQLTAGVIILLYLISTLKMFTLTKDELYDKLDI